MNRDVSGKDFGCLAFAARLLDFTSGSNAATRGEAFDVGFIVAEFRRSDNLDVALAGAVVDFDKAETGFGVATRANPAADFGCVADGRFETSCFDGSSVHVSLV